MCLGVFHYVDSEAAVPFSKCPSGLAKMVSGNIAKYYVPDRKFSWSFLLIGSRGNPGCWFRIPFQNSKNLARFRRYWYLNLISYTYTQFIFVYLYICIRIDSYTYIQIYIYIYIYIYTHAFIQTCIYAYTHSYGDKEGHVPRTVKNNGRPH